MSVFQEHISGKVHSIAFSFMVGICMRLSSDLSEHDVVPKVNTGLKTVFSVRHLVFTRVGFCKFIKQDHDSFDLFDVRACSGLESCCLFCKIGPQFTFKQSN